MPTIKEIIERVDENKPNAFSEKQKTRWIAMLDGKIAMSVFMLDIAEVKRLAYSHPDDLETETLVSFPHDDVYDLWLEAKIDFENGEYNKYQNTMEMFNTHYGAFVRWFADTYEPAQGKTCGFSHNRYYISAYGLSVKHGFAGTEEEWVASLIGEDGAGVLMRYENNAIQWQRDDDEQWRDLLYLDDLQGQVVAQTLEAARTAAQEATDARNATEGMTVRAETRGPGSAADVARNEAGGSYELVFGIPRGEQGPQGEVGPQGPQGVQGPPGPQGMAGVAVQADGYFAFNVTEDGMLQCTYSGDEAPAFTIDDDGHLLLQLS